MHAIMICGSRNPNGQTAQAAGAVLKGLVRAGASTAQACLPSLRIERCRQCEDTGWGLCRKAGCCVIDDDLDGLVGNIRQADIVVVATPVYYSDLSESLRAFADRLRRTCTHEAGRAAIKGKPLVGVCVAGGGGGGAPACCVSLEKIMATCGFDVVDMVPVRRQNLQAKMQTLERVGHWLASEPRSV